MRGLGSDNVDCRLRQTDFRDDGARGGIPYLGMPIAAVGALDRALVVGSFLRKDHPLLAHRLRQAAKKGAQVSSLHSVDDDWLMPIAHRAIVTPSQLPRDARADRRRRCARRGKGSARRLAGAGNRSGSRCDRRQPAVGRAAGDPARQLRDPASRRVADRRTGTGARVDHRRDARRVYRGGQHRGRLRCRRRSAEGRIERAGDAWHRGHRIAPSLRAAPCRAGVRLRQSGGRARRARKGRSRRRAE